MKIVNCSPKNVILMKFKKIGFILISLGVLVACNNDDTTEVSVSDQYNIDRSAIQSYLKTHYYDAVNDTIKTVADANTQTALKTQVDSVKHTLNGVDYYVYTLVNTVGSGDVIDDNDVVNINYEGMLLDHTSFETNTTNDAFFDLTKTINGWQYGLTKFKGGVVDESVLDAPRSYTGIGKGYLFIPSGLAYGTGSSGTIPANSNLIFKLQVKTVSKID